MATCKHCAMKLHQDWNGDWVDETNGDGCLQETPENQRHQTTDGGKQYHFVVLYNESTGEFEVDFDTQEAKFDNEPIYDESRNEWLGISGEIDDENSLYNRAADALFVAVRDLHLRPIE